VVINMNSRIENLDLFEVVFSRAKSRFMVFEDRAPGRQGLYISLTYDAAGFLRETGLIKLIPVSGEEEIPYEYTACPDSVTVKAGGGTIRIAIDEPDILRIKAEKVNFRLEAPMEAHEGAVDRLNGRFELYFASIGKLLMVPIKGEAAFDAVWRLESLKPEDVVTRCSPDSDGVFEMAIHEYVANENGRDEYRPFEECVREAREDYESWYAKYGEFTDDRLEIARVAAYTIWICRQIPHKGNPNPVLKNEVIYNSRNGLCFARAMDQFLQSMAITHDANTAYYYLTNIFEYMLDNGQLPNWINDTYPLYNVSRAPTVGSVIEVYIKHYGINSISNEQCSKLFRNLAFCASWWMNYRVNGDMKFHYHFREECGFAGSTLFKGGCPVCTADLMSFMAVLSDVIGRIANHMNMDEADVWWEYCENIIDSMLCDLWHATGYASRAPGGLVESGSILNFYPLILGGRLPQDAQQCLIDALKWDEGRSNEEGLLFEKGRDDIHLDAEQTVILGMLANGEGEEFLDRVVASLCRHGIYDTLPKPSVTIPGAMWSSSAAANALILLRTKEDLLKKEEA